MKIGNFKKVRKEFKKDFFISLLFALIGSILIASSFTPREFLWYHLNYDPLSLASGIMVLFIGMAILILSLSMYCLAGWYKEEKKMDKEFLKEMEEQP